MEEQHEVKVGVPLTTVCMAHTMSHWCAKFFKETLIQVSHRTKSCPNSSSEIEATKKETLFVLVLLCSMDWGSTHVFQPKNIDSTYVQWYLTYKVLFKPIRAYIVSFNICKNL